jgi:hypothetical protein
MTTDTTPSTPAEWSQAIFDTIFAGDLDGKEPERVAGIVARIQEQAVLKTVAAVAGNTVDVQKLISAD